MLVLLRVPALAPVEGWFPVVCAGHPAVGGFGVVGVVILRSRGALLSGSVGAGVFGRVEERVGEIGHDVAWAGGLVRGHNE